MAADAIEAGMSGRTKWGFLEDDDDDDALRNGAKLVEESSIPKLGARGFGVSVAEADSLGAIFVRWW